MSGSIPPIPATGPGSPKLPDSPNYTNGETELQDTTRSIAEVRRELNMKWPEALLLWICKTDIYALRVATYETRLQFQGFGLLVLITAMLAFGSMCFALSSTVFNGNWPATLVAAFLYAFVILMVEREIVDPAKSNPVFLVFRVVMAVIIALVISFPFEAEILKSRINIEITATTNERYKFLRDEQHQIERDAALRKANAVEGSAAKLAALHKQEAILVDELDRERKRYNYGPKSERLEQKIKVLQQDISREQAHMEAINQMPLTVGEEERIKQIDKSIADEVNRQTDPLSRMEALSAISKKVPEAAWLTGLLKAFFVILELMPALMKFLAPKTEYTFYVEARRALNKVMINAPTNFVMEQVIKNPQQSWGKYRQILDLIEHGIEDRSTKPARSLRDVLATLQQSSALTADELAPIKAGSGTQPSSTQSVKPPETT